jgi:hypothetical protein
MENAPVEEEGEIFAGKGEEKRGEEEFSILGVG